MAWKPTGSPIFRKQRDKWVVRVDGVDTTRCEANDCCHYTNDQSNRPCPCPWSGAGLPASAIGTSALDHPLVNVLDDHTLLCNSTGDKLTCSRWSAAYRDDGFVMFVGADTSGNLLEIGVIESVDGPIIIHAMTARP